MKKTTNYPIYLFEKPVLIPKELEETKELIDNIEMFIDKYETSRKIKSKAYNLCFEYFQKSLELNLDIVFQFSILEQDDIVVEFILEDKESEFVKQLRKYNQIFRDKGIGEFQYLYMQVMRASNAHERKFSIENKVIFMFYCILKKISNFQEEVTKEDKYKIIYQIEKPN